MNTIKLKILKALPQHPKGEFLEVVTDKAGTPLLAYWRARLRDAETDNCVEIVKDKESKKTNKPEKS